MEIRILTSNFQQVFLSLQKKWQFYQTTNRNFTKFPKNRPYTLTSLRNFFHLLSLFFQHHLPSTFPSYSSTPISIYPLPILLPNRGRIAHANPARPLCPRTYYTSLLYPLPSALGQEGWHHHGQEGGKRVRREVTTKHQASLPQGSRVVRTREDRAECTT